MKKQFVTYDIALKLKELGFDEECFGYFIRKYKEFKLIEGDLFSNNTYTGAENFLICAPLWQQAIDWLSLKHNITIRPCLFSDQFQLHRLEWSEYDFLVYENREQAVLEGVKSCQKK